MEVADLKQLKVDHQPLARAKLKVLAGTVPSKRGVGKKETMKASMLMKTVAALAVGAAFPLGAIAAQPAKTMTERGVIEKVNAAEKEFALKGGHPKRAAIFEWNASTQFVENGKPAAASELKTGERATVNYARQAARRDQDRDLAERQNGACSQGSTAHWPCGSASSLRAGDVEAQAGAALLGGEKQIEAASYLGGIEYDKWYSGKVKAAASARLREEITYRQFAAK